MITVLINLLVLLVVLVLVYYVVQLAVKQLGGPPVILQIVGLVLLLIFLLAVARAFVPGLTALH